MKGRPWIYLPSLLLGITFTVWGIIMIANSLYGVNFREEYGSNSVAGGQLFIFVGVIFFIVTYYSLSPFNTIKKFLEGGSFRKRKKKH